MTLELYTIRTKKDKRLPDGFAVVDLECTTNAEGKLKSVDGNKIHLMGYEGPDRCGGKMRAIVRSPDLLYVGPFKALVGHNIKYDLDYLRSEASLVVEGHTDKFNMPIYDYIRKHAVVLDTQFITYLHSGHTVTFASLEEACVYWGVPITKHFDLGEELKKVGHDITKVPDLVSYLDNDIEMTCQLISKIMQDPWVLENFSWLLQMHDGFLGTQEIEFNGMHVDVKQLSTLTASVSEALDKRLNDLRATVGHPLFDPSSNDQVAAYLFGADIEFQDRVAVGVYASGAKAGQPRYRINRSVHSFVGLVDKKHAVLGKNGKPSVSEDALLDILTKPATGPTTHGFIQTLLEYREYSKLLGTYLEGLYKHLRIKDGSYYVFPQINTCQTATGRTSSSRPNMQNNPTHDSVGVASIYTSRFGKEGTLLEVDFKQVEVLALAVLSGDKQLMDDILKGRDIHAETGKPVFGLKMTKEQRRVIKTINFGLIYGGGAATLAQQAKVPKPIAIKAINSFYKRYPRVKEYFDEFYVQMVELNAKSGGATGKILENGFSQRSALWQSVTGRRYQFKTYFNERTKTPEVSYTETRNYPIQGFATGDLVLCALGEVWRKLVPRYLGSAYLVGLVHDSLRFDVRLDKVDDLMRDLKSVLEDSGLILNRVTKKNVWTLPVRVSFSKGTDFFNMTELEY